MSKFLYPIYKLNIESYKKWWLYHKKAGGSGVLSEILEGFSFNLANTLNRKFNLFEIEGNSVQDGTPSPDNEVPILSSGDNENLFDGEILSKSTDVTFANGKIVIPKYTNNTQFITFDTNSYQKNIPYTVSFKAKSTVDGALIRFDGQPDSATTVSNLFPDYGCTINKEEQQFSITGQMTEDFEGLRFFRINSFAQANTSEIEIYDIKIEKGNKATPYSPYGMGSINEKIKNADGTKEQDYSIFVQQPMMDDDHFDRKNNKEVHTWIKYVLDGSDDENWSIRNNKFFIVDNINYSLWEKSISPNGKSNIGVISYSVLDNHTGYGLALAYGLRLNLENIDASNGGTIEQLRAYLAEHPITIYVKLKDSAYEKLPCTETQIQQLENKPSTYKDFTIIQSQDETPAHLKIQYWKEV